MSKEWQKKIQKKLILSQGATAYKKADPVLITRHKIEKEKLSFYLLLNPLKNSCDSFIEFSLQAPLYKTRFQHESFLLFSFKNLHQPPS